LPYGTGWWIKKVPGKYSLIGSIGAIPLSVAVPTLANGYAAATATP